MIAALRRVSKWGTAGVWWSAFVAVGIAEIAAVWVLLHR